MSDENRNFQPGDLAVLQNATNYHEYNGWLVEIIGPPSETWAMDCRIMERRLIFAYPVRLVCEDAEELPSKGRWRCMPWQLRRIGGPNLEAGDIGNCEKHRKLRFTSPEAVQDLEHQDS